MPSAENKTNRMSVTTLFEDTRFPKLAITWKIGSNKLRVCHKGEGDGAVVLRTVHIKGAAPSVEDASAEAQKWFDSIDVFEDEVIEAGDQWTD